MRRNRSLWRTARRLAVALALGVPTAASAGFASTETYLPAVGRIPGKFGAQFYTTIWATNLTGGTVHFTFAFLKQGQANTSPASFADSLAPGETKVYENVVETKLGLVDDLGAARVTSDGEILVSERIYDQAPGDDLGKTVGLFFAGVPKGFSISLGQSASIQGIDQGGAEDFRYNFALVETGGTSATAHVVLYDGNGTALGSKDYILQAYEQIQPNVDDLSANLATTNARITATVTAGAGSVLLAGAQLANTSQDSSGFEMSFRDDLLGGGGGGGLSAVSHDGTLVGNGTGGSLLGINPAAVVTSVDGLHGAVTLSAGSNVTITPSGQTLTIAASGGGGGGLTLPYSSSIASSSTLFFLTNTGGGPAIEGDSKSSVNPGVIGRGDSAAGLFGSSNAGAGVDAGSLNGPGVYAVSSLGHGVHGVSSGTGVNASAIYAQSMANNGIALFATNSGSDATVVATNAMSGVIYKGFSNGGTEVFEVNSGGAQVANNTDAHATISADNDSSTGDVFWGMNGGTIRFIITSGGDAIGHGSFVPNGIDYADRLPSAAGLEPGDVVAIGADGVLRKSTSADDPAVAGVYSTKPGVEGHEEAETRPTIPVALAGVIPVKVTAENGAIAAGDLLVSSSTPGRAMKAPPSPAPGTVLGKAMSRLRGTVGTVAMLVMLR